MEILVTPFALLITVLSVLYQNIALESEPQRIIHVISQHGQN
jgi:hypothetical protein